MRILITGGGGFIGSALVRQLSNKHRCVCFGHAGRFDELRGRITGDVEYVEGDVTDRERLREAMRGADAVIHAAGTGGEADCLVDPTRSLLTHVYGTHLVMREARQANVSRFIFTSTIAVYGTYTGRQMPLTEEMLMRPDEFYGALKVTAEQEIIDSGHYQILRLSNVYGGGSNFSSSGVAGKFVERAIVGKPLTVFGSGTQLIDYVHIDDVCRAFELALKEPADSNFIFNVGGGHPVSILELAEVTARVAEGATGRRPDIEHAPAPPDKLWPDRWLSAAKIERELGWRPRLSIEAGIKEMFDSWANESAVKEQTA